MNQATVERVIELTKANMQRNQKGSTMQRAVDQVNLSPFEKKSIAYARCRAAINVDCNTLYKDNAAGAKNFKGQRKKIVVEHLGGKIEWKDGKKFVMFQDGSQARY